MAIKFVREQISFYSFVCFARKESRGRRHSGCKCCNLSGVLNVFVALPREEPAHERACTSSGSAPRMGAAYTLNCFSLSLFHPARTRCYRRRSLNEDMVADLWVTWQAVVLQLSFVEKYRPLIVNHGDGQVFSQLKVSVRLPHKPPFRFVYQVMWAEEKAAREISPD